MWEVNIVKRIVPVLVFVLLAAFMYIVAKYVMAGMLSAFNSSGYDPSTWGFGYWGLLLLPVFVAIHYLLRAWGYVSGRLRGGSDEPRRAKPKIQQLPPTQNLPW